MSLEARVAALTQVYQKKLGDLENLKVQNGLTRDWGECHLICVREFLRDLSALTAGK